MIMYPHIPLDITYLTSMQIKVKNRLTILDETRSIKHNTATRGLDYQPTIYC